ncbi:MAG: hypothetical protein RLZZ374_658 [Cyanobacteriota bacterium]
MLLCLIEEVLAKASQPQSAQATPGDHLPEDPSEQTLPRNGPQGDGNWRANPQLGEAIALFNRGEWYACHDLIEDLWHQCQGPDRQALQGLLQIAVAQLHLERNNFRGATMLMGEGLGRLKPYGSEALGLELPPLLAAVSRRLQALQQGLEPGEGPLPRLGSPQG